MAFFVHKLDVSVPDGLSKARPTRITKLAVRKQPTISQPDVELRYIRKFRVLLCATCQYCILPQALDHHLKRIHHLPWTERQRITYQTQHLDLAASQNEARSPSPDCPPIGGLPCYDGLVCKVTACGHMCITMKRMEAHWREVHQDDFQLDKEDIRYQPSKLQTFFKGNKLLYFQVANLPPVTPTVSSTFTAGNSPKLLKSLPPVADDKESLTDWMLARSFDEQDWQNLVPVRGTDPSWKDRVLQASVSADYLRYIILSITASQIAYKNPDSCNQYCLQADRYRELAIQKFPANWAQGGPRKFFEIFNFARLMTMCYIAYEQGAESKSSPDEILNSPVLPQWVLVQRQGRALTWPFRGQGKIANALHGPAERLFAVYKLPQDSTAFWPHEEKLDELKQALQTLPDTHVDAESLDALNLLRKVWTVPYQENVVGFRDMALSWTARVSDRYIQLIQAHDPVALIIFGHFSVLWTHAEEPYWYMRGHAEKMLRRVLHRLDVRWHGWIAWPIEKVLGKIDVLEREWSVELPLVQVGHYHLSVPMSQELRM